ncbi:MAG TPA: RidA family protein [Methylomirabilota bacterium]|jgi:enamine deaminase RidA (YjgF/YER057c/UK114 family)
MIVEGKLASLGFPLPDLETDYRKNRSGARFVSHRAVGALLFLSGTVPIRDDEAYLPGLLGDGLTIQQGYEAARWALVQSLAAAKYALGDLDRVDTAIHLTGYVNSAPGFSDQPRVINGATDLLVELYGERGKPTRAAIGCRGLALNSSVELVLVVSFTGTDVRPPLARDRWAS